MEYRTIKETKEIVGDDYSSWKADVIPSHEGSYLVVVRRDYPWSDRFMIRHSVKSQGREWKTLDAVFKSLSDIPLSLEITTAEHDRLCDERRQNRSQESQHSIEGF